MKTMGYYLIIIFLVFLRVQMCFSPSLSHFTRHSHIALWQVPVFSLSNTAPPPEPGVTLWDCSSLPPLLSISDQQTQLWLLPVMRTRWPKDRLTLHTVSVSDTEQVKIKVFWAWLGTKSRTWSKVEVFSHSRHRCTTYRWAEKQVLSEV